MLDSHVTSSNQGATILCVDDEPSILSALRRLFRARGFKVLVAESGQAGLTLLESENVDLVISDMRMPEMDGVVFLENVRQRWPHILRLLLTGYADITSIMGAINRGEIYRYIAKPWDDNDILLIVNGALERIALEKEKKRLEALIHRQNDELKALNASLEIKVEARTIELRLANASLHSANDRLKNNFITSIKVFTSLIELRNGNLAGHSRRVAELSKRMAQKLGLEAKQVQEIYVAGLLHGIGKVGFDDELLSTPVVMMNTRQLESYRQHPIRAAQLLMPFAELKGPIELISAQLERYDGAGYPNRLSDNNIPLGARILTVASDFDELQFGMLAQRHMDDQRAHAVIFQGSGRRYDPNVVDVLVVLHGGVMRDEVKKEQAVEKTVKTLDLQPGMVLSRDLMTPNGMLMLTAGHVLDDAVIRKIYDFERSCDLELTAEVWKDRTG
jgi:response regulator RpfG family c-di-GMP phosphodiesterase